MNGVLVNFGSCTAANDDMHYRYRAVGGVNCCFFCRIFLKKESRLSGICIRHISFHERLSTITVDYLDR